MPQEYPDGVCTTTGGSTQCEILTSGKCEILDSGCHLVWVAKGAWPTIYFKGVKMAAEEAALIGTVVNTATCKHKL